MVAEGERGPGGPATRRSTARLRCACMLPGSVVRSARELLRRPAGWVPTLVIAGAGSLAVLLPLFDLPGLELGLGVALLCTLFGGWTGAAGADLFFASLGDTLTDQHNGETAITI